MPWKNIQQRNYNLGNPQQPPENISREAQNLVVEEPEEEVPLDNRGTAQSKTPQMPEKLKTPTNTFQVPTSEVLTFSIEETSMPSPDLTPITVEVVEVLEESSQASAKDEAWSIPCRGQDTSVRHTQRRNDLDHSCTISRNSTLNLALEPSLNSHSYARNYRSVTPDFTNIPVDEYISPRTQEQVRTSLKTLFPNGPPITPIRPLRRTEKNAEPHIAGCSKSNKALEGGIKTPKSLKLFKGSSYGITATTNCVEEEQPRAAKCARRGPHSANKNTAFNSQSNEIAERLKLNERGETPRKEPAFSPLPSTSTDNQTIIENDKHFLKSSGYYNLDSDNDDDDLPEIFSDNSSMKGKNKDSLPVTSKSNKQEDEKVDVNNEEIIIIVNLDYSDINFDYCMPKAQLLVSDNDPEVEKVSKNSPAGPAPAGGPAPPLNVPTALTPICPTTSSDVICIDDDYMNNSFSTRASSYDDDMNNSFSTRASSYDDDMNNSFSTRASSYSSTRPVLQTNNNIATSAETSQSDQVIEVPVVLEPIDMSRRVPVSRPAFWDEDVEFVSELRAPSPSRFTSEPEAVIELKHYLISYSESVLSSVKQLSKRAKVNDNKATGDNNKNAAPTENNENKAPATKNTITVNQVQTSHSKILSPQSGGCSSSGKQLLGECPICIENMNKESIASTNCGHVFCLECIRHSIRTHGKRCPSCRKLLKGRGYHHLFL